MEVDQASIFSQEQPLANTLALTNGEFAAGVIDPPEQSLQITAAAPSP